MELSAGSGTSCQDYFKSAVSQKSFDAHKELAKLFDAARDFYTTGYEKAVGDQNVCCSAGSGAGGFEFHKCTGTDFSGEPSEQQVHATMFQPASLARLVVSVQEAMFSADPASQAYRFSVKKSSAELFEGLLAELLQALKDLGKNFEATPQDLARMMQQVFQKATKSLADSDTKGQYVGDVVIVMDAGSSKTNIELFLLRYRQHPPEVGEGASSSSSFLQLADGPAWTPMSDIPGAASDGFNGDYWRDHEPPFELPSMYEQDAHGMYFTPGLTSFVDGDNACPSQLPNSEWWKSNSVNDLGKDGRWTYDETQDTFEFVSDCSVSRSHLLSEKSWKSLGCEMELKKMRDTSPVNTFSEFASHNVKGKELQFIKSVRCDCNPARAADMLAKCSWAKVEAERCGSGKCVTIKAPGYSTLAPSYALTYKGSNAIPFPYLEPAQNGAITEHRLKLEGFMGQLLQVLGSKTLQLQDNKQWEGTGLRTLLVVRATAGMRKAVPTDQMGSIATWVAFDQAIRSTRCPDELNCEVNGNTKPKCASCMLFTDNLVALSGKPVIPTLRIIPGPEEAFRGWLTAKYLHILYSKMEPATAEGEEGAGAAAAEYPSAVDFLASRKPWISATTFDSVRQYTYEREALVTPVFIEMGGSSVQIAYQVDPRELDDPEKTNKAFVVKHTDFKDQRPPDDPAADDDTDVHLYQRSFLYAGGEDVKKLYVRSVLHSQGEDDSVRGRCFPGLMAVGIGKLGPEFGATQQDRSTRCKSLFRDSDFTTKLKKKNLPFNLLMLALQSSSDSVMSGQCMPVWEELAAHFEAGDDLSHDGIDKGKPVWQTLVDTLFSNTECVVPTLGANDIMLNYMTEPCADLSAKSSKSRKSSSSSSSSASVRNQDCFEEIALTWANRPREFIDSGKCPNLMFQNGEKVVGAYCLLWKQGSARHSPEDCEVFSGGASAMAEGETWPLGPERFQEFEAKAKARSSSFTGFPRNAKVSGVDVPVWSSYPLDYGEECDVSHFNSVDRPSLQPAVTPLTQGAQQRDVIAAGSGFYLTFETNIELLSVFLWYRSCKKKGADGVASLTGTSCTALERLSWCGRKFKDSSAWFAKVSHESGGKTVGEKLMNQLRKEIRHKESHLFPSSLEKEITQSKTLMEVVAKWEQSQLRLTRCSRGFLKRTTGNKNELGSCVPACAETGAKVENCVEPGTAGYEQEEEDGAGMCKLGSKYLRPPLALTVQQMREMADIFCGDHNDALYTLARAYGMGKPPEALCLMTAYDAFLLHNLMRGFPEIPEEADRTDPATVQSWVDSDSMLADTTSIIFMMGVASAPQPGASFVPMAWSMGSTLLELAPVAEGRAPAEARRIKKKVFVEVEPLVDPGSDDAKQEKNRIPLRISKRLGEAGPSIDLATSNLEEEQKNAAANRGRMLEMKRDMAKKRDEQLQDIAMAMQAIQSVDPRTGKSDDPLFNALLQVAKTRRPADRPYEECTVDESGDTFFCSGRQPAAYLGEKLAGGGGLSTDASSSSSPQQQQQQQQQQEHDDAPNADACVAERAENQALREKIQKMSSSLTPQQASQESSQEMADASGRVVAAGEYTGVGSE